MPFDNAEILPTHFRHLAIIEYYFVPVNLAIFPAYLNH